MHYLPALGGIGERVIVADQRLGDSMVGDAGLKQYAMLPCPGRAMQYRRGDERCENHFLFIDCLPDKNIAVICFESLDGEFVVIDAPMTRNPA